MYRHCIPLSPDRGEMCRGLRHTSQPSPWRSGVNTARRVQNVPTASVEFGGQVHQEKVKQVTFICEKQSVRQKMCYI